MPSDATYPWLPEPNVSRDFVEFSWRLYEAWLQPPDLLRRFVLGPGTDEPIPRDAAFRRNPIEKYRSIMTRTLYRQRDKIGASGSPLAAHLPAPNATLPAAFDAQIADVAIGPIEARGPSATSSSPQMTSAGAARVFAASVYDAPGGALFAAFAARKRIDRGGDSFEFGCKLPRFIR